MREIVFCIFKFLELMKLTINGQTIDCIIEKEETTLAFQMRICDKPIYMFVRQKRFVSSRQIHQSPNMNTALLNINVRIKTPPSYFELLELELDGERDVYAAVGVKLPDDVPANPVYFKGTTGTAVRELRTMGEYMPFDEICAYTEDRLPSNVYAPRSVAVQPLRRGAGFFPSRCNRNVNLSELASKVAVFGTSEYSNGSLRFDSASFHEDGSMVVPVWSKDTALLVERMNRLVQFKEPRRRTVYDLPTYGRSGVDWVETVEDEAPCFKGPPFRHVDVKLQYQRERVEPHMSPFLACVASVLGVSVGKIKERLLQRVKRNTFPFYYNGALLRHFGNVHIPAYEDFLNYLKSDDRIDYIFVWEFVCRPGLFQNGVNLLIYDADRHVLIFPTTHFSSLGYQSGAATLAIVKEGECFSPMVASSRLSVKEWYTAPSTIATLPKGAKRQVVFEGKVMGWESKCLVPCKPTEAEEWADTVEYRSLPKMKPRETVDYLAGIGARPRYSYVEEGRCVGVWTEGMLFVPCEEGEPVLPLPELEAWKEFKALKGVCSTRLERSKCRWLERRHYAAYTKLCREHGDCVHEHVTVVDEITAPYSFFKNKLVVLRKFEEMWKQELMCYL